MTKEQEQVIRNELKEENGKLRLECKKAFFLAGKLDISISDLGKWCEHKGIRITSCQLGCF